MKIWEFGPDQFEQGVRQLGEESPSQLLILLRSSPPCRLDLNTRSLATLNLPSGQRVYSSFYQDTDRSTWLCASDGIWHGKEPERQPIHTGKRPTVKPMSKWSSLMLLLAP